MDYEQFFLDSRAKIDQIVRVIARRYYLSDDEADELRSSVYEKLIEDDYSVLRRFEQRSSVGTFLLVVIERHFFDHRDRLWGKWRPCREAHRAGTIGVLLDRLLTREGLTFAEAYETLRTNHSVTMSWEELEQLAQSFPARKGRYFLGDDVLEQLPHGAEGPDRELENRVGSEEVTQVEAALGIAWGNLSVRERLVLRMRFCTDSPVSLISRVLRCPQKPLYRELERLMERLRAALESCGVTAERVLALLGNPAFSLAPLICGKLQDSPSQ